MLKKYDESLKKHQKAPKKQPKVEGAQVQRSANETQPEASGAQQGTDAAQSEADETRPDGRVPTSSGESSVVPSGGASNPTEAQPGDSTDSSTPDGRNNTENNMPGSAADGLLAPAQTPGASSSSSREPSTRPASSVEDHASSTAAIKKEPKKEIEIHYYTGFVFLEGLLVAISGALHAIVWNAHFPSPTEAFLWRLSSIGMIAMPIFIILIAGPFGYDEVLIEALRVAQYNELTLSGTPKFAFERIWKAANSKCEGIMVEKSLAQFLVFSLNVFAMTICLIFIGVYMVFVIYLLVGSLMSLRNPPERTFDTPRWNVDWPHL